MRRLIVTLLLLVCCTAVFAQKKEVINYKKAPSGVEYYIFNPKKGDRLKMDQIIFLNLRYSNSKDSVLFDSWKMGGPLQIQITQPSFKGDLMDGLMLLADQDSASFLISGDSIFTKTFGIERPDFVPVGSKLKFFVKINRVTTTEALKEEQSKKQKDKEVNEKAEIDKYIADNKLNPTTTASGLKYVMIKEGTGTQAVAGKTVRVHYIGKLLNGTQFDASVGKGEPLEFELGSGRVIKGWDEGIALLKTGGKALLIIPFNLGWGAQSAGPLIPAFSTTVFEVELVEVK